MPKFRRTVPQSELRAKLTAEQKEQRGTDFQASRGGWLKAPQKPVPGTPKQR